MWHSPLATQLFAQNVTEFLLDVASILICQIRAGDWKSWQTGTEFVHQPFFIIPLPSSCHQIFTTNMRWIGWKMLSSCWLSWKLFSCGELTCERQWEGRGRGGWGGSCEGKYLMGDAIELSGLHSLILLILHSVSSGKYMRVESSQNSKVFFASSINICQST